MIKIALIFLYAITLSMGSLGTVQSLANSNFGSLAPCLVDRSITDITITLTSGRNKIIDLEPLSNMYLARGHFKEVGISYALCFSRDIRDQVVELLYKVPRNLFQKVWIFPYNTVEYCDNGSPAEKCQMIQAAVKEFKDQNVTVGIASG